MVVNFLTDLERKSDFSPFDHFQKLEEIANDLDKSINQAPGKTHLFHPPSSVFFLPLSAFSYFF